MAESSRKLVRDTLEKAFDTAFRDLQSRTRTLPPELGRIVAQSAEGIRTCLQGPASVPLSPADTQETVARLIYAHADPRVVALLRTFTETLLIYLRDARQGIRGKRMDS